MTDAADSTGAASLFGPRCVDKLRAAYVWPLLSIEGQDDDGGRADVA